MIFLDILLKTILGAFILLVLLVIAGLIGKFLSYLSETLPEKLWSASTTIFLLAVLFYVSYSVGNLVFGG